MTTALDQIPLGHGVDFKGPIGKFEYLGRGRCRIGGRGRSVGRFVMVCGGSGVTPIFQVLRAVMVDDRDGTKCVVLDGNRTEEDILCRAEIDGLVEGKKEKCKLVHALTQPSEEWKGYKGRVGRELLEREVGKCKGDGEELVLICGPEALEKSVHALLNEMGWVDDDLLFF